MVSFAPVPQRIELERPIRDITPDNELLMGLYVSGHRLTSNNGYHPTLRETLVQQRESYKFSANIGNDAGMYSEVIEHIESCMERVYSILSGKEARQWFKRVNLLDEVLYSDYAGHSEGSGTGLLNYINNARTYGAISTEYATKCLDYIQRLMDTSMTENRSFKRALGGTKWEAKARDSIDMVDMMIKDYQVGTDMTDMTNEIAASEPEPRQRTYGYFPRKPGPVKSAWNWFIGPHYGLIGLGNKALDWYLKHGDRKRQANSVNVFTPEGLMYGIGR